MTSVTSCITRTVSSPRSDLCPRDPGSVAGELTTLLYQYRYSGTCYCYFVGVSSVPSVPLTLLELTGPGKRTSLCVLRVGVALLVISVQLTIKTEISS